MINVYDCNIHYLKALREKSCSYLQKKTGSDFMVGMKHYGKVHISAVETCRCFVDLMTENYHYGVGEGKGVDFDSVGE